MAQKPIIFLDIDGVMNSEDCFRGEHGQDWGTRPVNALNAIIKRLAPCEIVISSSWRYWFDDAEMAEHLRRNGVVGAPIIGHTAIHVPERPRGQAIWDWLERNSERQLWVILDDYWDMQVPELSGSHIRTMWATGLGPEHVEPAVAVIKRQRQQIRATERRLAAAAKKARAAKKAGGGR